MRKYFRIYRKQSTLGAESFRNTSWRTSVQWAIIVGLVLAGGPRLSGQSHRLATKQPKELVEEEWNAGRRGDLLTPAGWSRLAMHHSKPSLFPGNNTVLIFSDFYAVNSSSVSGATATVDMEFTNMGRIDSLLRYTPAESAITDKTSFRYRLVLVPCRSITYGPDGKTIVEEPVIADCEGWQIDSPLAIENKSWTTVNGAIRYVLEMREKTSDSRIKKNADETLGHLLRLH